MVKKIFIIGIGGLTGSKLSEIAKNDFEIFGSFNFRDPKEELETGMKVVVSKADGYIITAVRKK